MSATEAAEAARLPRVEPAVRARHIQRVLLVTLVLNLGAAVTKLLAAWGSGSLALLAGGVDSTFDASANVIGLLAVRAASRPPDRNHPYGHRKIETLVAVVIAFFLFLTCGRLAWEAVLRLGGQGAPPEVGLAALTAPLVAFGLNAAASAYEMRWGRRLGSELLVADAGHTRADAAVSLALVVGLLAVRAGYPLLDPLLAIGISAVVAWVGVGITRETFLVLTDAEVLDPDEVVRLARQVPGVRGAHKVRSRGPGDAVSVDLHVQVDSTLGVQRGHEIGHMVKDRLRGRWPTVTDVVVHVEPDWPAEDATLSASVRRVIGGYPVDVHEIVVHDGRETEVCLHIEMDPSLSLVEADAVARQLEEELMARLPAIHKVSMHLEPRTGWRERVEPADEITERYEALVRSAVDGTPGLVGVREVRAVRSAHGIRLSARVTADAGLALAEAHVLCERLESRLRAGDPGLDRITLRLEPDLDREVPMAP